MNDESRTVPKAREYTRWKDDHDEPTKRPYRLWDAVAKQDMPHRYYSIERNALNGALLETAWGKVGTSIEVYDCRTARHIATFTRRTNGQITRWVKEEDAWQKGKAA